MLILFFIAYYIERRSKKFKLLTSKYVYALSFAIFCTAWTYYGSVGKVSDGGFIFLAVYLGPTLIIFLWPFILRRLIKIKERYKITSLADLISARYDKSIYIGAFVSFGALVGIIPYISIQLKAVIQSMDILIIDNINEYSNQTTNIDEVGLLIVVLMSFFTIIFGLRKLDPSERHYGIMFIVAIESVIKLIALVIIGIFVSYFVFDDISSILNEASKQGLFKDIGVGEQSIDYSNWLSILILSMFAVMFLPRQFHVSVVENSNINHIKTVMWLLPLYLFLITLFTLPIALAGSLLDINHQLNDFYVITIPSSLDQPILALIAFIGGFSASTSMIMITSMAMAIMVSNYFILPLIELIPSIHFLKKRLLLVRWVIVTVLIYLGYLFYIYIAKNNLIVNIGLISFTAILQFAPVIIAALFWEKANKYGAFAAMLSGFAIWFYTLIIPQFPQTNWIPAYIYEDGLFGLSILKSSSLLGLNGFDAIPHAVFWSMIFNISSLIIVSLLTKSTNLEVKTASDFINILEVKNGDNYTGHLESNILIKEKVSIFKGILNQYIAKTKTDITLNKMLEELKLKNKIKINILELSKLYTNIERILSGTLGTANAHKILEKSDIFTKDETSSLSSIYSNILKNMKISPDEFSKKINYFQEKEKLLNEHYEQLKEKVKERDIEIEARKNAQNEIIDLNETLEVKVEDRTKQLQNSNIELERSMSELKKTQDSLIESEKMASLGELVAGVAHEINTPVGLSLTGITHFISTADKISQLYKKEELSEEEFENFINISSEIAKSININLEKTAQLVRSFKQVAVDQSSNGKRSFGLCEYLDEILISIRNVTKKTKIDIIILCKKEIIIDGYPGAISQVITNLIMNTIMHGYDKNEKGKIEILLEEDKDIVKIIYKDYGRGINKENQLKVFNPFFTTNRKEGGSGLGLSIIYNIVTTKLNGHISLESVVNEGSTFTIEFSK
jgi:Na+/proline symporter/signal transduction histidine kinase